MTRLAQMTRIQRNEIFVIFIVAFVILVLPSMAFASEMPLFVFDREYHDQGVRMELKGTGLKKVAFFRAFEAAFYQFNPENRDVNDSIPKRIEVKYFVHIPAKKLNNFTIERMKINLTNEEFKAIQKEIQRMEQYFVDLRPGDRFSLTYIPGVGTKFAHNGRLSGIIKGEEFARALFSVWIGEKPFDPRLKEQILGVGGSTPFVPEENVVFRGRG